MKHGSTKQDTEQTKGIGCRLKAGDAQNKAYAVTVDLGCPVRAHGKLIYHPSEGSSLSRAVALRKYGLKEAKKKKKESTKGPSKKTMS
ncbi:uncharacterized protein ARB_04402 [Trichophyton benhamiae CBS 112371]|uniref:Uncharacterized protein n=1 Tax=Arthroderma benhamiae (strain ATCC MYA-4681 / CBS 112371) TaxID=663331 RepID=D4AJF2_ARTBC|nr:uncharacterized protein ARB_04402 [Trichophyton benhamiae CBS 112371]EFE36875.1 hypothetical protein ARB_04402 [Trichophyton benhamiae CBS 112371]